MVLDHFKGALKEFAKYIKSDYFWFRHLFTGTVIAL